MWLAVQGPLEHYGNQLLWANFTSFLLVTMVAAPLFVLATPLTLAFRVTGPAGRARLRRFYRGIPMSWLTFPVVAWLAFAVVTYVWQFTALTSIAAQNAAVRDIQMLSLLLVGLLFWYPAFAVDPIRWRLAYPLRGLYVLLELTHKGLFGGMFLSMETPFHGYFAENLPAWGPTAMHDQRLAILVLWLGGNLIFVAALISIAVGWSRYEARNSRRIDRRLERERAAQRRHREALEQVFQRPV
jgi:putative membrane protein